MMLPNNKIWSQMLKLLRFDEYTYYWISAEPRAVEA